MNTAAAPELFSQLEAEAWLSDRLKLLGASFNGDYASVKDQLKHVIESEGYEIIIASRRHDGKPESFAEAWERIFGEPFHAKPPNRKRVTR